MAIFVIFGLGLGVFGCRRQLLRTMCIPKAMLDALHHVEVDSQPGLRGAALAWFRTRCLFGCEAAADYVGR